MLALLFILSTQAQGDWPVYGRDPGGSRFSPLTQISRDNVARLQVAWTYHTGEQDMAGMSHRPPALEVTPLVVDGVMYLSTPAGRIIALDPATGAERWRFDAGVNPHRGYGDFASRGVAFWRDARAAAGTPPPALASSRPRSTRASSPSMPARANPARISARTARWICAWACACRPPSLRRTR